MKPTQLIGLALIATSALAAEPAARPLWPGAVPGETKVLPPEADTTQPGDERVAGRTVLRLSNVSTPTLTFYRPDPAKDTGAAVVVCPGGGYYVLAMDLEGTEVCAWLNSIGVTGVLLKYRVPVRPGQARYVAPLQDVQRAMGLVRQQTAAVGIDPQRLGVLGFSAGAHLAAALAANSDRRTYPVVDEADAVNCRPDFMVLIYPGWLISDNPNNAVLPEVAPRKGVTPPTFMAMAEDDGTRVESPLAFYLALKQAHVPAEMHLYPTGGHGYGLRRTNDNVTTWPDRMADWLKAGGWLQPRRN